MARTGARANGAIDRPPTSTCSAPSCTIVTGKTPHAGRTPIEYSMPRRRTSSSRAISPASCSNALKAMQTEPKNRYQSVAPCSRRSRVSITRGIARLNHARATRHGQADGRAVTPGTVWLPGALALWDGNRSAAAEISGRRSPTPCAKAREDFDLAASLLDATTGSTPTCCGSASRQTRARGRIRRLKNAASPWP